MKSAPSARFSLLTAGLGLRLALAACAASLLWLAMVWALD
jgi:hypothetical protein